MEGLSWASGWRQPWEVPAKGAIFKARQRLGREPLRALFEAVAVPLAIEATRGAFYRQWRLMSIDGTCLDVADTPANEQAFGRPGSGRGEGVGAFPQLRLVGLARAVRTRSAPLRWGRAPAAENELADAAAGGAQARECCALPTAASTASSAWQNARTDRGAAALAGQRRTGPARASSTLPDGSYLRAFTPTSPQRAQRDGVAGARRRVPAR